MSEHCHSSMASNSIFGTSDPKASLRALDYHCVVETISRIVFTFVNSPRD